MSDGPRIVVVGAPKTGKTTLAMNAALLSPDLTIRHTDDLVGKMEWSEASLAASEWFDVPGPWLIEGVATARALRKWLARNPTGKPCDGVIRLTVPQAERSEGQERMGKGVETVFAEIEDELRTRGVVIR